MQSSPQSCQITRRRLVGGAFAAGVLAWGGPLCAHEGHGAPQVIVDIASATVSGGELRLVGRLTNIGSNPLALLGLYLNGAGMAEVTPAQTVAPYDEASFSATLSVSGTLERALTVMFDFGVAGQVPVLVQPR